MTSRVRIAFALAGAAAVCAAAAGLGKAVGPLHRTTAQPEDSLGNSNLEPLADRLPPLTRCEPTAHEFGSLAITPDGAQTLPGDAAAA